MACPNIRSHTLHTDPCTVYSMSCMFRIMTTPRRQLKQQSVTGIWNTHIDKKTHTLTNTDMIHQIKNILCNLPIHCAGLVCFHFTVCCVCLITIGLKAETGKGKLLLLCSQHEYGTYATCTWKHPKHLKHLCSKGRWLIPVSCLTRRPAIMN